MINQKAADVLTRATRLSLAIQTDGYESTAARLAAMELVQAVERIGREADPLCVACNGTSCAVCA